MILKFLSKISKSNEKIKPWIENVGETGCLEPAFKQNTNDDGSRNDTRLLVQLLKLSFKKLKTWLREIGLEIFLYWKYYCGKQFCILIGIFELNKILFIFYFKLSLLVFQSNKGDF